jgi:hypothetical protein
MSVLPQDQRLVRLDLEGFILFGIFIGALAVVALGKLLWDRLSNPPRKHEGRRHRPF